MTGDISARTALTALSVKLGEDEVARGLGVPVAQVLAWNDDISSMPAHCLLRLEELAYLHTALSDLGYPDRDVRRWFLEAPLARGHPIDLIARGDYADADELRLALFRLDKRAQAARGAGLDLPPLL